ncbi:MAG: hypothetical protein INQ03_24345 [Candidatus Heimdallarchaeota archaeon]|nr:hypothetical protein [Candidatus Heimdallarchaeota archaeon]
MNEIIDESEKIISKILFILSIQILINFFVYIGEVLGGYDLIARIIISILYSPIFLLYIWFYKGIEQENNSRRTHLMFLTILEIFFGIWRISSIWGIGKIILSIFLIRYLYHPSIKERFEIIPENESST